MLMVRRNKVGLRSYPSTHTGVPSFGQHATHKHTQTVYSLQRSAGQGPMYGLP